MAITEAQGYPEAPTSEQLGEAVMHSLEELDAPPAGTGEGWRIEDAGSADWALRKLAKVREQIVGVNYDADAQIAAIEAAIAPYIEPITRWRDAQIERLTHDALHWESLLVAYHRAQLAEDPKAISIVRPHGTLKSRKNPDRWEFEEAAFVAWARAHSPELIRTKEEIDKALTKKTLLVGDDGEVQLQCGEELVDVAGVSVTVGERHFEVVTEEVAS